MFCRVEHSLQRLQFSSCAITPVSVDEAARAVACAGLAAPFVARFFFIISARFGR